MFCAAVLLLSCTRNEQREEVALPNVAPDTVVVSWSVVSRSSDRPKLVGTLRSLQCCALPSSSGERSDPSEAKPQLEINFGDMQCEIELWDREWREGRARECGFAFALFHHSGFVPDPPVDEPSP
ncbi:MAG: hypothetical protein JRG67_02800 [Deltaproteobacteria bacterium]|nr:hypothetical protein [Deltaproteobacteria bacterium]